MSPGWVAPSASNLEECSKVSGYDGACVRVPNKPDTFFVAQHTIPAQELNTSGSVVTYQRSTQRTSCVLHRGKYILETMYLNGKRTLNVSTDAEETLENLWAVDQNKPWGSYMPIPLDLASSYQVINIFALFDSLVQAVRGEYYDGIVLMVLDKDSAMLTTANPVIGFLRKPPKHSFSPISAHK
jgi:hypothetical protein